MFKIASRVAPALSRGNLSESYNKVRPALTRDMLPQVNFAKSTAAEVLTPRPAHTVTHAPIQSAPAVEKTVARNIPDMPVPRLEHRVLKGQKTALGIQGPPFGKIRIGFGWNIKDKRCDVDASAFMLDSSGHVIADEWFVFYGQPVSPDGSLSLKKDGCTDRTSFALDLDRMDKRIVKIVLIVSINEALENGLNFGMLKDAYVRITDEADRRELVSFELQEYYANVTSMTFGELYLHNEQWKFNPIGNGVHMDLAGQCAVYGVEIG